MFSFLGLRSKDSKKSSSDREADGGFVIVGETLEEQRRKVQNMTTVLQPCSSNVIVLPNKSPYITPTRPAPPAPPTSTQPYYSQVPPAPPCPTPDPAQDPAQATPGLLPDLLGDVPFSLAPHLLALQGSFLPLGGVPDVLLSQDLQQSLSSFHYDFTLENSVLCNQ